LFSIILCLEVKETAKMIFQNSGSTLLDVLLICCKFLNVNDILKVVFLWEFGPDKPSFHP
jgi:hypothetical protein